MTSANNQPASRPLRPAFMDAVEAAANLKTDRLTVLQYIKEGRMRTFGGKADNPFVRTEDVDRLARELAVEATSQEPLPDPKVVHRNDPVRKLKLRLQQDAKWPEIDEKAMRAWAEEVDPISFQRMRRVAEDTIAQLQMLIRVIDETEKKHPKNR